MTVEGSDDAPLELPTGRHEVAADWTTSLLYLDWNATTPPLEGVVLAMADAAREAWGNPSSVHAAGRAARARVEAARAAVAELFGADPRDVIFTSGGTEANNLAVRSLVGDGALVTTRIEHPSIVRVAEALAREGRDVRWARVLATGAVDVADVERLLAAGGVSLVAIQAVNGETGVMQPIDAVIAASHAAGARVHVDAVQAIGKVAAYGAAADSWSVAPHKFRGPKGIGALVTRAGVRISPVLVGGSQERGLRPGTVDAVLCAGVRVAAEHAKLGAERYAAIAPLRDRLEQALVSLGARVNGSAPRVPHVTNVAILGWSGPELVAALDLEGLCVSSGSACSAGTAEPSPVIDAMHGKERALSSIRFSLGETTTMDDIDQAISMTARVLARR